MWTASAATLANSRRKLSNFDTRSPGVRMYTTRKSRWSVEQQIDALRQRSGESEGRVAQLLEQREQQTRELDEARQRLEAAAAKRAPGTRTAQRTPAKSKPSKAAT